MIRTLSRPSTANCTLPMYIGFLLSEPNVPSCCCLAEVMEISHDSVNRFLQREAYTPRDLFNESIRGWGTEQALNRIRYEIQYRKAILHEFAATPEQALTLLTPVRRAKGQICLEGAEPWFSTAVCRVRESINS